MKTVLTIAGFDPSSGAGISADLKTFAAHGVFGTACITALTVQNTVGVFGSVVTPPETITSTLQHLVEDLPPAGIKIGMLATSATISEVARFLHEIRRNSHIPVVLDPVLESSSGRPLLDQTGVETLREELLPLVDWITPNLHELSILARKSLQTMPLTVIENATQLQKQGKNLSIVVTSGDQTPPTDLLVRPDASVCFLEGEHIVSKATHGTGCAFSSSLLCRLVLGDEPLSAAKHAKQYVASAIRLAYPLGHGRGPINHLWPVRGTPDV